MRNDTQIQTVGEQTESSSAENFLTKQELAPRLRKTPRTIEQWTKRGILPAMKIGRSVLYSWPDVQAALKKFTVNAGSAQ